ncbi:MAG: hypothetical protein IIU38_04365, partial [Bacteroidaceae bacterium]|nr:hypothetical protein [Bacteroidaceae bacterium]
TETLTFNNVDTSVTVTFPTSWQEQLPNSATGTIACTIVSLSATDNKIGANSNRNVTGEIPATVLPTLSVAHQAVNDNANPELFGRPDNLATSFY